ncbi:MULTISPECIES: hypothetical protein [Micromonospora]|uniref:hypothetical protein n=1 Tax=Micromonospora TaxID=1873 RepID=UPI0011CE96EF|nr:MULTISPECIES: hypothetical protein [Micromonospora]NES15109.1 hypothetical protein [Micromonospora sp. PPF5-17B]NES39147.1 hypothetical protein [Micromonospora solifontis]NES56216.1 hypothetical protein [Micromonospora sp. PPF5-6]
MTTLVLTVAGVLLLAAGPVMIAQGVLGRRSVVRELAQQRIAFPSTGLPSALARYADAPVRTGPAARAYSDLIAGHVAQATGGRTYAEIAQECMGTGRGDERLDRLRQTAFMGETLRGALLGAYQAWQVTALVIGLGGLVLLIGAALLLLGLRL